MSELLMKSNRKKDYELGDIIYFLDNNRIVEGKITGKQQWLEKGGYGLDEKMFQYTIDSKVKDVGGKALHMSPTFFFESIDLLIENLKLGIIEYE